MVDGPHFEPNDRMAQFVCMIEAFERDEVEAAVDMFFDHLDRRNTESGLLAVTSA